MSKKIISIVLIVIVALAGFVIAFFAVRPAPRLAEILGTWCWNEDIDLSYVDFATSNGVNEIYYCGNSFNETNADFIFYAQTKGMTVYFLCGNYTWLTQREKFDVMVQKYISFNAQYPRNSYTGIHLDVEPHQSPDFGTSRTELISAYIEFVHYATTTYPSIKFDFDIPFWIDDEITFNAQTRPAYEFVIDFASRIFVMSYRDTAQDIVDVAAEELAYAASTQKTIFLSVDTKDLGADQNFVTFFEEGSSYMLSQLKKLSTLTEYKFNLSIHHLASWCDMKK